MNNVIAYHSLIYIFCHIILYSQINQMNNQGNAFDKDDKFANFLRLITTLNVKNDTSNFKDLRKNLLRIFTYNLLLFLPMVFVYLFILDTHINRKQMILVWASNIAFICVLLFYSTHESQLHKISGYAYISVNCILFTYFIHCALPQLSTNPIIAFRCIYGMTIISNVIFFFLNLGFIFFVFHEVLIITQLIWLNYVLRKTTFVDLYLFPDFAVTLVLNFIIFFATKSIQKHRKKLFNEEDTSNYFIL
jgi:hypothetical protein